MLHVGGLTSLLKEGSKHLSGVQEAVVRNIEAVKEFILIVRSSMGPNGGKIHLNDFTGRACSSLFHIFQG